MLAHVPCDQVESQWTWNGRQDSSGAVVAKLLRSGEGAARRSGGSSWGGKDGWLVDLGGRDAVQQACTC